MSDRRSPATRSGFAQFASREARDQFVRSALDPDPALKSCAFLAESQPTIIFENLTARQVMNLRSALADHGRWFDDVQFQPMS